MTDVPPNPAPPVATASPSDIDARTYTLIIYGLYIGGVLTGGCTGLVGVIMAYIRRAEYKGTIWESHIENAIHAFWVWLLLFVAGIPLTLAFGLGILVMAAGFIYFLYRSIKGLIAAIDSKPYV
ncbi:MAG: hypothetical protein ISS15_09775 [Alphaproteobacteria bacterium]|nr:hypothetical protein [Alphaproteobacteria bacterium]MBL6938707.1 hypothetical protein [Alphaproteobacteria bacterium]MBL7097936.1 hypothetical protein [Alphaproteobacteria bacterium]